MTEKAETIQVNGREIHLPEGTVLKPPVTLEELQRFRDPDPEGAEEFIALIMSLRKEPGKPPVV